MGFLLSWIHLSVHRQNSLPLNLKFDSCFVAGPNDVCSAFNNHFAAIAHLSEDRLTETHFSITDCAHTASQHCSSLFNLSPLSMFFPCSGSTASHRHQEVSWWETGGILDPFLLRLSAPIIKEHIFNLSILSGIIPSVSAHVVPMHKGGDINNINNYRPISKLLSLKNPGIISE